MEIISYGDNFNKHFKLFTFSSQTLYLDYSLSSELTPSIECKMCGNEVLHVAAQKIVLKDGSVQPFSENKVCIAIVSYLIFIKNSALAFAIYLLLLEMLLKSKKKKRCGGRY